MSPAAFLSELGRLDIHVWMDGDQLRCNARTGVLTAELREQLRQRKSDIVKFLRSAHTVATQQSAIVPLQQNGTKVPVFAVPGHNGDVFCYRALAQALGDEQPFFGLQPPGLDGHSEPLTRVEDLAGYFADQVRAFRPHGPWIIAGFCAGGTVAFDLAQRLLPAAEAGSFLALFGAPYPAFFRPLGQLGHYLDRKAEGFRRSARALAAKSSRERFQYIAAELRRRLARPEAPREAALDPVLALRAKVEQATLTAVRAYEPLHFPGRANLFMPCNAWARSHAAGERWRSVAPHAETYFGADGCTGDNMLLAQNAPAFAELFRRSCERPRAELRAPKILRGVHVDRPDASLLAWRHGGGFSVHKRVWWRRTIQRAG